MTFNVKRIVEGKDFSIVGMSYIGAPRSNTAMFITKKVEHLLGSLDNVFNCLIFAENGVEPSLELQKKHAFSFSSNPQLAYADFANLFEKERMEEESKLKYIHHPNGYLISETAVVGDNAYIEPNCIIGHGVRIGKNAKILYGSVIKHAIIGDNFVCNEYAVVGANGFTMAEDQEGNKKRIPTLGRVLIGDNVEVGVHNNISCGSGGDTVIEDNVKLDALIHLGHDVHLHKNVEITAGGILGGFVDAGEHSYIGVHSTLRNRITIGENAFIGMGSNVTKSVEPNVTVAGNPAKLFMKG